MSKRWVYCPLCEGWNMVSRVTGKETNCPACGGAGMVQEKMAKMIRHEMDSDMNCLKSRGKLYRRHGVLAETLHRKLAIFSRGMRRDQEGMAVAISRAATFLANREQSVAGMAGVQNIVMMPGEL